MEVAEVWAKGGKGAERLAELAAKVAEQCVCQLKPLYDWNWSVEKKIETIAKEIYGAAAIDYTSQAKKRFEKNHCSRSGQITGVCGKNAKIPFRQSETAGTSERFHCDGTANRDCRRRRIRYSHHRRHHAYARIAR